jgi:acrylyl-CoA reductase (NADPH)
MAELPDRIRAFVAERSDDSVERRLDSISAAELPPGDVTIRVEWSSLNYKDGLAVSPNGQVARISPLVPGVDLAGAVVASDAAEVGEGDRVLVHGYALGVGHHGGLAEYARVPADWVVPLPAGLSARQAMALGTAGFTAALSVVRLEQHGLAPDRGPVLVLGATGGVGSTAVGILSRRGYEVHASTGKPDQEPYLRGIGAAAVLPRAETSQLSARPLESQRWAACVDPVGGAPLAYALRTMRYGGAIASSGLTAGTRLETTVLPFVLRAVSVLGIDSVELPIDERRLIWARLADDLRPRGLDESITREVTLDGVDAALDELLAGRAVGRTVVRIGER